MEWRVLECWTVGAVVHSLKGHAQGVSIQSSARFCRKASPGSSQQPTGAAAGHDSMMRVPPDRCRAIDDAALWDADPGTHEPVRKECATQAQHSFLFLGVWVLETKQPQKSGAPPLSVGFSGPRGPWIASPHPPHPTCSSALSRDPRPPAPPQPTTNRNLSPIFST